jgi:hypothetical protein
VPLLGIAAFEGWPTLALTFLASVVIEDLKAYVISPRVQGQQLNIDPLLVIIAVLVGSQLLGAIGAFVAVPFAAVLQVLFERSWCHGGSGRSATRMERPAPRTRSAPYRPAPPLRVLRVGAVASSVRRGEHRGSRPTTWR